MLSRFLDTLGYSQNHPVSVDDTETTTPRIQTSQDYSQRCSFWIRWESNVCFGVGSLGGYSYTTVDKIKEYGHILQQNQNLQSRQIQNQFALINLTGVDLGDHTEILYTLDLTPLTLTHRYLDKFSYLERSRNLKDWMTDINARLSSACTEIIYKIHVYKFKPMWIH